MIITVISIPASCYNHSMKITSPAFAENAKIPKIYAKLGGNQRPPLAIDDVPADAKSLAIICHDPDAPGRDGFYHWTVWNVPGKTAEISSESLPAGAVEGITSWGRPGWGGPQPPFGTHRYQFYVYALDTTLDTYQTPPNPKNSSPLSRRTSLAKPC